MLKVYLWSFSNEQLDLLERGRPIVYQGKLWDARWIASDCVELFSPRKLRG